MVNSTLLQALEAFQRLTEVMISIITRHLAWRKMALCDF